MRATALSESEVGASLYFKVSVVVPCYNAERTLAETLTGIALQQWNEPWEVVVADNRSTDGTRRIAEALRDRFVHYRIVSANEGQGTPYAINAGVREARGRSVVFCDADDVPAPGWLAAMGRALEQHEFVSCRMDLSSLNSTEDSVPVKQEQAGGLMKLPYPPYVAHAGGGTLGIRRSVFLKLGSYDPAFVYLHETDFCVKAQLAGHELHFVPDAIVAVRARRDRISAFKQAYHWGEYDVLLAKRYKSYGQPRRHRWLRWCRGVARTAIRLVQWPRYIERQKMIIVWQLGWELGKIKGMINYLVGPY